MMLPESKKVLAPVKRGWLAIRSVEEGQRSYIRSELAKTRGLIPLLMKNRNGEDWSEQERLSLLSDLRTLTSLSPYLIPLVMPGGVLLLPLLAWWLDRRRKVRDSSATKTSSTTE